MTFGMSIPTFFGFGRGQNFFKNSEFLFLKRTYHILPNLLLFPSSLGLGLALLLLLVLHLLALHIIRSRSRIPSLSLDRKSLNIQLMITVSKRIRIHKVLPPTVWPAQKQVRLSDRKLNGFLRFSIIIFKSKMNSRGHHHVQKPYEFMWYST